MNKKNEFGTFFKTIVLLCFFLSGFVFAEPDKEATIRYIEKSLNNAKTEYYNARRTVKLVHTNFVRVKGEHILVLKYVSMSSFDVYTYPKRETRWLRLERRIELYSVPLNQLELNVTLNENKLGEGYAVRLSCTVGKCVKNYTNVILDEKYQEDEYKDEEYKVAKVGKNSPDLIKKGPNFLLDDKRSFSEKTKFWLSNWGGSKVENILLDDENITGFKRNSNDASDKGSFEINISISEQKAKNLTNALSHLIKLSGGTDDPFATLDSQSERK